MTTASLSCQITLHRPWWQRWVDAFQERVAGAVSAPDVRAFQDDDFLALRELNAGTLRDIGAPDWIGERREALRRIDLDLMRL